MNDYERDILTINSANLAANLENVGINVELLRRAMERDNKITALLSEILEELKHDRK